MQIKCMLEEYLNSHEDRILSLELSRRGIRLFLAGFNWSRNHFWGMLKKRSSIELDTSNEMHSYMTNAQHIGMQQMLLFKSTILEKQIPHLTTSHLYSLPAPLLTLWPNLTTSYDLFSCCCYCSPLGICLCYSLCLEACASPIHAYGSPGKILQVGCQMPSLQQSLQVFQPVVLPQNSVSTTLSFKVNHPSPSNCQLLMELLS